MRKRGQNVKLRHVDTGQVVKAKVIIADSKQGYLAELADEPCTSFLDAWKWYHPNEWKEWK